MKKTLVIAALVLGLATIQAQSANAWWIFSNTENAVKSDVNRIKNAPKNAVNEQKAQLKKQQEAQKKALEKKQAELKKQQEAQKKALEKKQAEQKAKVNAKKNQVNTVKKDLNTLFSK